MRRLCITVAGLLLCCAAAVCLVRLGQPPAPPAEPSRVPDSAGTPPAVADREAAEDPFAEARRRMAEAIASPDDPFIAPVTDPLVLEAMRNVPRHLFVPAQFQRLAYDPHAPLPIGAEQTISAPDVVAAMSAALQLEGNEKVLEIGTGSGYQAAVLAEIAREVYTIEIVAVLGQRAAKTLERLGYDNVHVRIGDGYLGWPERAPFDAVIVTAAPDHVPQPLIDQLKEGGRMVIPVGGVGRIQQLKLLTKVGDSVQQQQLMPVRFVPMTGEAQSRQSQK